MSAWSRPRSLTCPGKWQPIGPRPSWAAPQRPSQTAHPLEGTIEEKTRFERKSILLEHHISSGERRTSPEDTETSLSAARVKWLWLQETEFSCRVKMIIYMFLIITMSWGSSFKFSSVFSGPCWVCQPRHEDISSECLMIRMCRFKFSRICVCHEIYSVTNTDLLK